MTASLICFGYAAVFPDQTDVDAFVSCAAVGSQETIAVDRQLM